MYWKRNSGWEEPDLTSHDSFWQIKKVHELLVVADKYAIQCNQNRLEGLSVYRELGMWYNALNRAFINTESLLGNLSEYLERIKGHKKGFEKYFKMLNEKPSLREDNLRDEWIEKKCIELLDEIERNIMNGLQEYYFFYRMGEKNSRMLGMPETNDTLIKKLRDRGFDVTKKSDRNDKSHKA